MRLFDDQPLITEELCAAFASAANDLALQRASQIPERLAADFVKLDWVRQHDGVLHLTPLGKMTLAQVRARMTEAAVA